MFLFRKNTPKSLSHLDHLFKNVISKLPVANQIKYCESLMYRTKEDISNSTCRLQKRRLNKLLQATKNELKNLNTRM